MISCEQAWELLSRRRDEPLSPEEAEELEAHLAVCPSCRKDREELERMEQALRSLEELRAPADFTRRVMDQVEKEPRRSHNVIPLLRRPQVRALAGLAACALLCIGIYRLIPWGGNLSGGMVSSSQQTASVQPAEGAEDPAGSQGDASRAEPDQSQTGEEPVQSPAAQPRVADLDPESSDQSSGQTRQSAAPYAGDDSSSDQAQQGQSKAQAPQAASASGQTELVLYGLPDEAAQLLPGLGAWSVDEEGSVSCTVSSQVLEQLCGVLDETGTEYTVSPAPWSESCIVRLG